VRNPSLRCRSVEESNDFGTRSPRMVSRERTSSTRSPNRSQLKETRCAQNAQSYMSAYVGSNRAGSGVSSPPPYVTGPPNRSVRCRTPPPTPPSELSVKKREAVSMSKKISCSVSGKKVGVVAIESSQALNRTVCLYSYSFAVEWWNPPARNVKPSL